MGCDIHSHVELRDAKTGKWEEFSEPIFPGYGGHMTAEPFGWRNYGVFAFLTHTVRNYSAVPPVLVSEPRGIPDDSPFARRDDDDCYDFHSHSFVTLHELVDFDY